MKTKFILGSLALAATFVGCSNELDNIAVEKQSGMIELGENFMIGVTGNEDSSSRTHWAQGDKGLTNVFAPVVATPGNNKLGGTPVQAPAIGLCWVGQSVGSDVYTNYEFIHNGWLGNNQNAPVFNECDESELLNGWLYSDVTTTASDGEEVYGSKISGSDVPYGSTTLDFDEMNWNSGVYKTENKSIFGGQYIAYYPYNPDFINAGTIPAKSALEFNDVKLNDYESMALAENTFRYTNVSTIDGGAKAEGFEFKNLSGLVCISLQNAAGDQSKTVEKILLYSKSGAFKKEVRLSAAAIAAKKTGTELYAETVETGKTILINMASANSVVVKKEADAVKLNRVWISMLPQTISDLAILAYDEGTESWAECTVNSTLNVVAGGATLVNATVSDANFKKVFYAVDQATLETALSEAKAAATSTAPATVKILGDIRLSADVAVEDNVIVEGDDIYVPEDVVLQLWNCTMKSNLIIEGETCCGGAAHAGQLNVLASTIDGDITIEKGYTGKKNGSVYFMPGTTNITKNSSVVADGNIYLNYAISGTTIVNIAGELENNATITVYEDGVINTKGAEIKNNGTIEVLGEFNVLDATGATVAAAGEKFTNNGTFIDNVGAKVGGATQYMINNGDYICKVHEQVRLDEAYENKLACNIIEFVNVGGEDYDFYAVKKHNGKDVDLVVSASVGFAPTVDVTLGNVTVNKGKNLYIHKSKLVAGSTTNYAEITINGNLDNTGNIYVREDVRNLTAKNFTTNKNGAVTFENRYKYSGKTMIVSGTIEVKNGGTFTIEPKSAAKNVALVTCTKLIEGGTFNGKPTVVK